MINLNNLSNNFNNEEKTLNQEDSCLLKTELSPKTQPANSQNQKSLSGKICSCTATLFSCFKSRPGLFKPKLPSEKKRPSLFVHIPTDFEYIQCVQQSHKTKVVSPNVNNQEKVMYFSKRHFFQETWNETGSIKAYPGT